jgi:ABC-type amino acid transport substrate-binding protein
MEGFDATTERRGMKTRLFLILATALLVLSCGGTPALAREDSPQKVARRILGHAPRGLAKAIVERGSVIVANDSNYYPQSFLDPNTNKVRGFDVDVAERVGRILGLKVVFRHPAWEYVPRGLRRGLFDVSIGSMELTPAREAILSFTAPYRYAAAQVFVKQGGPQITGVRSLFGKRVGVGRDSPYEVLLEQYPQVKLRVFTTDADVLSALGSGKVRFVLTDKVVGRTALQNGKPIEPSGAALFHAKLAFALREGQEDWWTLLDYTVRRMHRSGALREMSMKWYHYDWTEWRWRK